MDWLRALLLSIVQGVTEFLPISSSGHLILVPYVLGWRDQGLVFDIAANTGTLFALLIYFRRDVVHMTAGWWRTLYRGGRENNPEGYLAWAVGLATIPVGVVGLLAKSFLETHARGPMVVASTLIFFGLLLGMADRMGLKDRELGELGWRDAWIIGMAQAMALIPGTSRSGVVITMALVLGFNRDAAARFAFWMAIPVGILAALLDVRDILKATFSVQDWVAMGVMVVGSAVAGYLVIGGLLSWLRCRSLMVFVIYRILLGLAIFALAPLA